jgi:hypothetical protein
MKKSFSENVDSQLDSVVQVLRFLVNPKKRQPIQGNRSAQFQISLSYSRPISEEFSRLWCSFLQPWIKILISPYYLFYKIF